MDKNKIDFVIIWVDGNDPEWCKEKAKYAPESYMDNRTQRFREWDILRYWFRGVEQFAPWVNQIHFVTWKHLPEWLNVHHPKLHIVKHSDYIPQQYLPTFSSHPIELNLHRISGLEENFVYFNDDMFLIAPTKESDFFKKGLPCDSAVLNVHCHSKNSGFLAPERNIGIINQYFNMKSVIRKNPMQWFNLKYKEKLLRTLVLLPCPRFPGMWQAHLPTSFQKSVFKILWKYEYDELNMTCIHKFRHLLDYNQWLMKEWQIASGKFYPRDIGVGKFFQLEESIGLDAICSYIEKQKGKMICINDGYMSDESFEKNKRLIKRAFQKILPEKSKFEINDI